MNDPLAESEAVVAVEPSDAVRLEWLHRVEAEYRSSASTQSLTLWLTQLGVSPDLVRQGLRIAADEVDHAELSFDVYAAAGGESGPSLPQDSLGLRREPGVSLEADVTRACVDIFCLGETIAVPLFKELRAGCTVDVARAVLDRVLVDEVRHRDFGWSLLEWLLDQPFAPAVRSLVNTELPRYYRRLVSTYGRSRSARKNEFPPADRAWGLMPAFVYADVLERASSRDFAPRFAKLGIDSESAWRTATASAGWSASPETAR